MSATPLLLGLDVGTTSIKAIVFDLTGQTMAQAAVRTPTYYPRPGQAYYKPEELWQCTLQVIRAVTAQVDQPARIAGLAVASFAETSVALDAHGQAIGDAIAWFDNRTVPQAAWLAETIGADALFAITGVALQPIFGLCKLLWLRQHSPEEFARTRRWLNTADYIAYRLCGVAATDYSLASRTLLLNLGERKWSAEVLERTGLSPDLLAPLLPSGACLGPVLHAVAAQTGLPTSAQVSVGGHDHVCGALAVGVTQPGDLLNSMGTAEAVFLPLDKPLTDPEMGAQGYAQGVHVGGAYYLLGGLYTSGACVDWFRENFAGGADYATLIAEGQQVPAGSLGTIFLPHLRAANPPHLDALARSAFIGLRSDAKRGALFRAVLEGLSYEVRNTLEPMLAYAGLSGLRNIYVTGGGAYNELHIRVKASILNRPLKIVSIKEATALGAALLGGLGAGLYTSLEEGLRQVAYTQEPVDPVSAEARLYDECFRTVYQPLYNALRPLHHALDKLLDA